MKHWFYVSIISDTTIGIPVEAASYEAAAEVVQRNYRRFVEKYFTWGLRAPEHSRERKDHQKLGRLVQYFGSHNGVGTLRVIVEPRMAGDDGILLERQLVSNETPQTPIPDEEIDALLEDLDGLFPTGAVSVPRKVRH